VRQLYPLVGEIGNLHVSLMIVAKQRYLPKIILIESDVLSRAVDSELVEKFSRRDRRTIGPDRRAIDRKGARGSSRAQSVRARTWNVIALPRYAGIFRHHIFAPCSRARNIKNLV
jgi:hypothetical protein